MRRLIIGDIHGCFVELQDLLDKAGLVEDDEIIALGDIVDRGPDSPRVIHFFQANAHARSLMGNHERKHVRSARDEISPALSQVISRQQFGAKYLDAMEFMQTFPRSIELDDALLVHGFFEPAVPLKEQRDTVVIGTLSGEKYLTETYPRPWYELYQGSKPIIVGHRDYLGTGEPFVYRDRVFGLDTGCYGGGALTGLLLPDFRIVSVRSRKDYWTELKREHRQVSRRAASTDKFSPNKFDARILNEFAEAIQREHARIRAQLTADPSFHELSPHAQGKMYALYVQHLPRRLQHWLYLARRGELNLDALQNSRLEANDIPDWIAQLGA